MFKDQQTVNLFPCPVWLFDIEPDSVEIINRNAMAAIEQMRPPQKEGQPIHPWQSRNDLQTLPEFEELSNVIKSTTGEVLKQRGIKDYPFQITGCWINIRTPGNDHPAHTHPNNYVSGCYYVNTPEGGNAIVFRDPKMETNIIAPPLLREDEENSRTIMVPLQSGMMAMFPSWLPHFVPPNQSNIERISIAFNIMFSSFGETIGKPLWTFDENP
ncbi:MAG: 2OG-Fe(II) oxygenase family protein [Pirellulales bacterium]|nr:2OG-Fe(II) oxygenase family protein [Pirellulales bacterium]